MKSKFKKDGEREKVNERIFNKENEKDKKGENNQQKVKNIEKDKTKEKNGGTENEKKSLKQAGPYLEVSAIKPGEKKIAKKLTVAGSSEVPKAPSRDQLEVPRIESRSGTPEVRGNLLPTDDSFIVCSHIAEQVDMETITNIAKKHGVDIEHSKEEQKEIEKEMKRKIKAWKKCPNRMDFRNCCRDPLTGGPCPVVQAFMTPQPYNPWMTAAMAHLPPGTIGIGRRQVAFHAGGPLPNTNDPHLLELGRRADGTMCLSVQYAPDPMPVPESICTTVRETQAALAEETKRDKSGRKKSSAKGKKKGKKK